MRGIEIRIKRIYEERLAGDGLRILVDRLWPRGVSKDEAGLDLWAKQLAPSTELRKWFSHDPARFEEFERLYWSELEDQPDALAKKIVTELAGATGVVTLLYAARDTNINHATVLKRWMEGHAKQAVG